MAGVIQVLYGCYTGAMLGVGGMDVKAGGRKAQYE